ncbi:D-2-hydroxyacid dehydrogenase family protein [Virgibacillus oceani]
MKTIILDDWEKYMLNHPSITELKKISEVEVFTDKPSFNNLIGRLKEADIIIPIRERTKIDKKLIDRMPNLKMIAQTGTGLAHIDIDATTKANILIATTPGGSTKSVTEITFSFLLNLIKNVHHLDYSMKNNLWPETIGTNLHGKTLGIIGLGKIGGSVANIAKTFGMNVIAWGPTLSEERALREGVKYTTLHNLLETADAVTLHVRLVPDTIHLLRSEHFNLMKNSAVLINTSRGKVIDEKALIEAIQKGNIAGAGLDVFYEEPLPKNHPLRDLNNVLLTPHVGWKTQETFNNFLNGSIKNIKSFFIENNPQNIINKEELNHKCNK